MTQQYDNLYYTYPVFSSDTGLEAATKRYKTMPTPQDVYDLALLGLPKFFPISGEQITPKMVEPFLENAITEIEMAQGFNITPVKHEQSFDYVDGLFHNFTGLKLERWPATSVQYMKLKFPHTQTVNPGTVPNPGKSVAYQTYGIPGGWISLRRNRINVVAAYGAVSVQVGDASVATAGGVFSYITGFGRGLYQPAMIEVSYTAGFDNDKLPSTVWDLIVTLAQQRFLEHIAAPLFPVAGTTVSIDGVSQSASMPGPQMLIQKIDSLKEQYTQKANAITKVFGRTMKLAFIGA